MYAYPFVSTLKQPSQEARVDDITKYSFGWNESSGDFSDGKTSLASSRSDTTSNRKPFDEGMRAISAVMGKFQQQREIANKR